MAKAVYRAIQMKEENSDGCKVGIALPATLDHRKAIGRIAKTLEVLSIAVFWVGPDKFVEVQGNWETRNKGISGSRFFRRSAACLC